MDRWVDKVAVVTGASSGIGDAIARRLAKDGLKVAALARRADRLQALEREVKESGAKGVVKGYICDVTSESDVTATFRSIEEDFGPVSVLVNNAGSFKPINPTDIDLDSAKGMMDLNVNGVLNCVKSGVASMKAHSLDGHVINISSIAGQWSTPSSPNMGFYSATKHALNMLTVSLRAQLKKDNLPIRVTTVSPGLVETPLTIDLTDKLSLGQYVLADDVADAVAYVISAPHHVNLSDITVDAIYDISNTPQGKMIASAFK